ncbi:MAG: single-stranded-DNA-specific exonuclease RecJ [Chthoniobacterales bacterium]|nr:single-stranded-DNA-specific exonuclease RecJ [Chthoniobacterales bacterium]
MIPAPRWILAEKPEPQELCGSTCISRLLQGKGLTTSEDATDFLRPRLRRLSDPFLLPQMREAVDRILLALTKQERIVLYGDYDVDGVTSLALLHEMLSAYGAPPALFLPSRMEEGYGLSREGIERCWQLHQPQLLIAIDCGTSSCAEIADLAARGADVIVLDHHEPTLRSSGFAGEPKVERPDCVALVNPKAGGDDFSYLCSVGIVFKLCHALLKLSPLGGFDLRRRLDLVALGTVADIVPLEGENRILVHHGAREIARRRLLGLSKLMDVAAVRPPIVAEHIGFRLGPRLNAAGRLTSAEKALRLLLTADEGESAILAAELDAQNRERQSLEREIVFAAEAKISFGKAAAIVLGERGWHPGVLGIVASRIARKYHRPTFVVGFDEQGRGKGSGRSIPGLSLVAALGRCGEHLEKSGGHEMAAGLTIREENFPAFAAAFEEACREMISPENMEPRLHLDHELSLAELTWDLLRWHELLQPFGNGNPQPLFFARAVEPMVAPQILKERHLLLRLRQEGRSQRAIFFGGVEDPLPEPPWDIAFRINGDEYEGEVRLQMQVEAIRAAAPI